MIHQIPCNNMVAVLPSSRHSSDSLPRLHARTHARTQTGLHQFTDIKFPQAVTVSLWWSFWVITSLLIKTTRWQENGRPVTRLGRFNHPEKSLRKPMRMRLYRPQNHSGRLGEERSLLLLPECRCGRAGRSGVRILTVARDYHLHTGCAPIQPPSQ